jgi:hypothetical protein
MTPLIITPVAFNELHSCFNSFNFSQDSSHIQEYVNLVKELSFCYQSVIHKVSDGSSIIGFTALRTTYEDIDGVPGILVEFLYLKKEYRAEIEVSSHIKYSFLVLDYIIEKAIEIQKIVAINHVYLVPINDKVRQVYYEYGFENIPGSGKNEFEDYMVFNLLEEDPTIL